MSDYRSRLLEIVLGDELSGDDHRDGIEALLNAAGQRRPANSEQPRPIPPVQTELPDAKRRSSSFVWVAVALAAGLLIAAVAVNLLGPPNANDVAKAPAQPIDPVNPVEQQPDRSVTPAIALERHEGFVMPASAVATTLDGVPVLETGWAYAAEGAPRLRVGGSELRFDNARAVVAVGNVPEPYQAFTMSRMLGNSELVKSKENLEMLMNPKKWIAGMGVCVCLLGGQATLGDETVTTRSAPPEAITITDVFNRYDLNGDGLLAGDECICKGSKQCDTNEDGQVSFREFSAGVEKVAGSHEKAIAMIQQLGGLEKFYQLAKSGELEKIMNVSMESVFAQWDRDGSGVLEADECVCEGSRHADANEDGKVTAEELAAVAEAHFGSTDDFLTMVRQRGGVEAFYDEAATYGCTTGAVFARYDKNKNGTLEPGECVCQGSKMADFDNDGHVTKAEFAKISKKIFGSQAKFEEFVRSQGGSAKFYEALAAGKLPKPKGS